MPAPIDFYFDFSSPYGYIASHRIEALAAKHERTVRWRPTLLGAIFKLTGARPLASIPLKADYARRDFARSATFHGVPFRQPSTFPIPTVAPVRAFYWLDARNSAQAIALARALYDAYFQNDRDISDAGTVAAVASELGLDAASVRGALNDAAVKERARNEVDASVARGVFGSPFLLIDGEPFWGVDRFDQAERWLATGGW